MNLYKLFKRTPMPEHDAFNASLKKRLFSESTLAPRKSWLWALFPSSGAVALAALLLFISSNFQPSSVALADAIANTIQFTPSEELIEQTVSINRSAGVGAAPTDFILMDEAGNQISAYPQTYIEKNTWWLYKDNARVDTTRSSDGVVQYFSSLISAYDKTQCTWDSTQAAQGSCDDLEQTVNSYGDPQLAIPLGLKPFVNDGTLEISNLTVKPYVDPDGDTWDIMITFESNVELKEPGAMLSTGPSGYPESGYPGRAWVDENGKFQNEIIYIHSEDLRFNAANAFYPDDSEKTYLQIVDNEGTEKSDVYLLNIDDYTLTPASDAELLESQEKYQELVGQFGVSIERMERDYELIFGNVRYLQDHLSELEVLDTEQTGSEITLSYGVPADLGLYGGTNNALITKASFTIDQNNKRVTTYSFYDGAGTVVEHAEISSTVSDTDPKNIFSKEAWSSIW